MGQAERVRRLSGVLGDEGLDAFFGWSPITNGYLAGFAEDPHERFLALAVHADGRARMICPALSEQQVRRAGIEDVRAWKDGEDPIVHLRELADDWNLRSAILAVDDVMPARMLLEMQAALPAALFKPGGDAISQLMRRKDASEIEKMKKAGAIVDESFPVAMDAVARGLSEVAIEQALREEIRSRGGRPTFCIVAVGAGSAEPHHLNGQAAPAPGDVVCLDFGCSYEGYQSDITRVVCRGNASSKAKEVYDIVYRAFMAGRSAIRPGVPAEQVDAAARKVIEDAGYGPFFIHRLGHGIGMEGHEPPYIIGGNTAPLEPGNCFSVEPGIYLPGEFGVRIENCVVCTESGHDSLNAEPSPTLLEV